MTKIVISLSGHDVTTTEVRLHLQKSLAAKQITQREFNEVIEWMKENQMNFARSAKNSTASKEAARLYNRITGRDLPTHKGASGSLREGAKGFIKKWYTYADKNGLSAEHADEGANYWKSRDKQTGGEFKPTMEELATAAKNRVARTKRQN